MTAGGAGAASRLHDAAIATAALILIGGGLIGEVQLVVGDFVVTGSLPAKGPIVGVALILYAASVILGFLVVIRHGWLAATNLAIVFAVLYLIAWAKPLMLGLGLAHAVAAAILVLERRRFGITQP